MGKSKTQCSNLEISMNQQTAIVIGGGIGGLGTACLLAKAGYKVELFEKNEQLGGRASLFSAEGFRFDMGPSWYLMPDLFEHFFALLDERVEDHLELVKLQPSYRIFFQGKKNPVDLYSDLRKDLALFETLEPGSGEVLKRYLETARVQYEIATQKIIYKNYDSWRDFLSWELFREGRKLNVFQSMNRYVSSQFSSDEIQKILQYSLVFLGSSPYNTPALYNIMSHIDFSMGVFYPQGGIYTLIEALVRIGTKLGVKFHTNAPVQKILIEEGHTVGIKCEDGTTHRAEIVVSNADHHFTEQTLLPPEAREHDEVYWQSRVLSPSAFILYLGIDREIPALQHHNLFFSKDWKKNFEEIFDHPAWPEDPSYYLCNPNKTDPSTAPKGMENLFVLVPISSKLSTTTEELARYRNKILTSLANTIGMHDLEDHIVFERTFCIDDFKERYHSFGGSALGLAHTLTQTALFRPNNENKKVQGLYYVGGNTNPGIGMPMCLVSAELVYKRLTNDRSASPLSKL